MDKEDSNRRLTEHKKLRKDYAKRS